MSQDTTLSTTGIATLDTTVIECTDLGRMLEFYTSKLGLVAKISTEAYALIDGGGASIVLWQGEKDEIVTGFTTADLAQARELLEQRGAQPTEPARHPQGEFFYVEDPAGHKVMIST